MTALVARVGIEPTTQLNHGVYWIYEPHYLTVIPDHMGAAVGFEPTN